MVNFMRKKQGIYLFVLIMSSLFVSSLTPSLVNEEPVNESLEQQITNEFLSTQLGTAENIPASVFKESKTKSSIQYTIIGGFGIIDVYVFDELSSAPIALAPVNIYKLRSTEVVKTGFTNKEGFFQATELYEGYYNVSVTAKGYQPGYKIVELESNRDHTKAPIYLTKQLRDSGFIQVYVRDATTTKEMAALIQVYYGRGFLLLEAKTDEKGFLNVTKLTVQDYTVVISRSGYVSQKHSVTIDFIGDSDKLKIYLSPEGDGKGFIEVYTYDIAGNSLVVTVEIFNSTNDLIKQNTTDKNGFYNATDLEIGKYNVSVSARFYESQAQETKIDFLNDGDYLKFILSESIGEGFIYGYILDDLGTTPIAGASVQVNHERDLVNKELITDKNGFFNATGLPIGTYYKVYASADDYSSNGEGVFLGIKGAAAVRIFLTRKITFENNGFFEVTVFNESKIGINESLVLLSDKDSQVIFKGETDSSGFVNITGLEIGKYEISVIKAGYETSYRTAIITYDGDSDIIHIRLIRLLTTNTGFIEFEITDLKGLPIVDAFITVIGDLASRKGFTAKDGSFNATDLYIGDYNISVSHKGFIDYQIINRINYVGDSDYLKIVLREEETSTIRLFASFEGVPDQSGEALVRYKIDDTWSDWMKTDATGEISLKNLAVGEYTIEVQRSGYEVLQKTASISYIGELINLGALLQPYAGDGVVENWAIIVAGQIDQRFTIDSYAMYYTLINYYGYDHDHIYYCAPRSIHPLSGNPVPRDRVTSKANVEWLIDEVASQSDYDDRVFVWWTGHGGYDTMDTYTNTMTAVEFDTAIDTIHCEKMYIFLGPCHSGTLINELEAYNRAIYTSCANAEGGWATSSHSFWPYATVMALNPNNYASIVDVNSNDKVSLNELYWWAYTRITVYEGLPNQHPQRWIGDDVYPDSDDYIGDGTYAASEIDSSIEYLFPFEEGELISDAKTSVDTTDIIVEASVNILDEQLDFDDFAFQVFNTSGGKNELVSDVTITLYKQGGSIYAEATTNSTGFLIFYDVPDGTYAWEAILNKVEVRSGELVSDGYQIIVYPSPENWDLQGDGADVRFNVEEAASSIFVSDVTISTFRIDGTFIGNCTTNYIGDGYLYDLQDGSYGYEAYYQDNLVDDGFFSIDSSLFTIETDSVAPAVKILSPELGDTIFDNESVILYFSVIEENNYTISIFIDGTRLSYKNNGTDLQDVLSEGTNTIKVRATDIAGNFGEYEITITIRIAPLETTTTPTTTTTTTPPDTTTSESIPPVSTPGFTSLIIFAFAFLLYSRKKK